MRAHSPWRSEEAIQAKLLKAFIWIGSEGFREAIRTDLDVAESGLLRRFAPSQ
jgi:hypothetical protein